MEARKEKPSERRFERATVLWSGSLVFREQIVPCVIVNISAGGALVRTEEAAACVNLVIVRNPRFGDLKARVTWRKSNELGLKFVDDDGVVSAVIGKAFR